jgi:hypothetical protein
MNSTARTFRVCDIELAFGRTFIPQPSELPTTASIVTISDSIPYFIFGPFLLPRKHRRGRTPDALPNSSPGCASGVGGDHFAISADVKIPFPLVAGFQSFMEVVLRGAISFHIGNQFILCRSGMA